MTYTFKTKGEIKLPMTIDHNAVHQRIKDCETIEEKQELIRKTNPLLYALGKKLKPTNHYTNEYRENSWAT